MPALSAHGLIKRYGTRVALDDVSIALEPGEFVAVLVRPPYSVVLRGSLNLIADG